MSHKSGHIIIENIAPPNSEETVQSSKVELQFAAGVPLEDRMQKIRQAYRLLEKLDHEDDED
jgi:hypothetical protein